MTTYTNKSNAVRAAKREFGDNFEVKQNDDGLWAYIRSGGLDREMAKAEEAPVLTDEEEAIVDDSVVVSVTDDGALVGEAEDGTLTTIAPATIMGSTTHDLGHGWSVRLFADGSAMFSNDDGMINLEADSVQLLRDIIKGAKVAKERKTRDGGPTLREQAAALLTQEGGTTAKEILDLTKWPSVSVPALAKASKLTLRKEKVGKVTRYYGKAA